MKFVLRFLITTHDIVLEFQNCVSPLRALGCDQKVKWFFCRFLSKLRRLSLMLPEHATSGYVRYTLYHSRMLISIYSCKHMVWHVYDERLKKGLILRYKHDVKFGDEVIQK